MTVEADLSVPGHPEVFVIGDLALFTHQGPRPLPGVAPVAIQEGPVAAENAWRSRRGLPTRPFRYRDRGTMAVVGRAAGIATIGPLRPWGAPAWIAWSIGHLFWPIGFENRLLVFLQWAWAYLVWKCGPRLITTPWQPGEVGPTGRTSAGTTRGGSPGPAPGGSGPAAGGAWGKPAPDG